MDHDINFDHGYHYLYKPKVCTNNKNRPFLLFVQMSRADKDRVHTIKK